MLSLSSTGINEASLCLKKYQYHFIERLIPRPALIRHPMRRGIWIHACLEAYHEGRGWLDVLDALRNWADSRGVDQDEILKLAEEVESVIRGYILYWESRNEPLVPYLTEQELSIKLGDRELRATLDMVAKTRDGRMWIVEHKSTARIPNATWRSIDVQTAMQMALALANGIKLDGILFNYLNTNPASVPRVKKDGTLYANTAVTTKWAFDQCLSQLKSTDDPVGQLDDLRFQYVNDAKFYQRWEVLRPMALLRETMADVDAIFEAVEQAQTRGRYPRSVHIMNCEYCAYGELCAHEYTLGKEAPLLRAELFEADNGQREGRIVIPQAYGDVPIRDYEGD